MNTIEVLEKARDLFTDDSVLHAGTFFAKYDNNGEKVEFYAKSVGDIACASCFCMIGAIAKVRAVNGDNYFKDCVNIQEDIESAIHDYSAEDAAVQALADVIDPYHKFYGYTVFRFSDNTAHDEELRNKKLRHVAIKQVFNEAIEKLKGKE